MKKIALFPLLCLSGISLKAQQYSGNLEIEKMMDSSVNSAGQKILYSNFKDPQVKMMKIAFPPRLARLRAGIGTRYPYFHIS